MRLSHSGGGAVRRAGPEKQQALRPAALSSPPRTPSSREVTPHRGEPVAEPEGREECDQG